MSIPWFNRRSSTVKPVRISNSQYAQDLAAARASRSVEQQSKIPRSSSQSMGREKMQPPQKRSKSQLPSGSTPVHPGKITPNQLPLGNKITPTASSNMSKKRMEFVKDTRKLQDKEFLKEASGLVQTYFRENCAEVLMNGTDIRPMTIKMFIAMVNHLFEALEIVDKGKEPVTFQVSSYEKELPYWMKKLDYPGLITKAWLQTVNVPQYWPHVVGLLSWLVKLVSIVKLFSMEEKLQSAMDGDFWPMFYFQHTIPGFTYFNDGKEDEYRDLCDQVISKFYECNNIDNDLIKEQEEEIERLRQKLDDPNALAEKDAFDEAEQRLRMEQAKEQKYTQDIEKNKNNLEEMKMKILKKQRNCLTIKREIEAAKKEIESLNNVISTQSISVTELADIKQKTDYVNKEINCLEKECEDYSQLITRYESQAAVLRDKILQSTHTVNRYIIQLKQMVPELKDFHVYVDPDNENIVEEMEKMVKSLETFQTKHTMSCERLKTLQNDLQTSLDSKKQKLKELSETVQTLKKKNKEKKTENEELKKEFEEKENVLKEESEILNQKLKTVQEKLKEYNDLKNKKIELKERYDTLCDTYKHVQELEEQFWAKVHEKYKNIPDVLKSMVDSVNTQNVDLRQRYSQLANSLD